MCRLLGCVARDPVSLRHELLDAGDSLIRAAGENDSGWGMAVYPRGEGDAPRCARFPDNAAASGDFEAAADTRGRIVMAHVRKATVGGLSEANTQPFCLGEYAFCHNGTLARPEKLLERHGGNGPSGETDSERLFHRLLREVDPAPDRVVEGLRAAVTAAARCAPLSALNFLFSDGEHLYAYRLGLFELHWLRREGQILVASERITGEGWHGVRQDVLLVMKPGDDEPHAERLIGDEALAEIQIDPFDDGSALRGAERARFAAERAPAPATE
jgi:predicted glutamine amidotransferase